ncbi:MAG TPA: DUF2971 domain-containing protein [Acidobacteriaceae bacterium]
MHELDRFIMERPSGCLYHYTGAAGVIGILESRDLWATDYRHLNDRQEYRLGARLLKEEIAASRLTEKQRKTFEWLAAETQSGCFVLSFSERGDQLSQWRAYCPGGAGYALGFGQDSGLFSVQAKQHSFNLVRCEYDPGKQRQLCKYLVDSFIDGMATKQSWWPGGDVPSRVKSFLERYQWNLALALVMSALKHRGFKEEKEWRLVSQYPEEALYGVSFRPGRFGVTPYFTLPIAAKKGPVEFEKIVIGPTPNQAASRTALELLLSKYETSAKRINLSLTPLRH